MNASSSKRSTRKKQPSTVIISSCKICGDTAKHFYYGVLSCAACKMFFKRNAENKQKVLKCVLTGDCEISIKSRHICVYCRLNKCFQNGMQVDLIRCSSLKTNKTSREKKRTHEEEQNTCTALVRLNQHKQFRSLNLLQTDQSTLSINEWNLISNLSHCYDEYSGLKIAENYICKQKTLPSKLRLKPTSIIEYYQAIISGTELLYKNNQDFLSLSPHDRITLLHHTIQYTTTLSSSFISHQMGLNNHSAFYIAIGLVSHPKVIPVIQRIQDRLDFDMITMKLFLAILSFTTINHTDYFNTSPINLVNRKEILRIQNTYIELTWKYLIHKYKFERTVRYFSDFIRCLFAAQEAIVIAQSLQWFTGTMDSIVQQTQQTLNLND